ncbi:MAG TPA: PDZ domain-containing protein [Gemmatimonadales bacterium]|jgi:hypothetical protein
MRSSAILGSFALLALAACNSSLPPGTTEFTVGHTHVRTDSVLDLVGVVYRMADTSKVPALGPARHWLTALKPHLNDSAFQAVRAPGPMPVSLILETYAEENRPDTTCGYISPGTRRCFTGNDAVQAQVRTFLKSAASIAPLAAGLDEMREQDRRRDLADVRGALTRSRSLDSAVLAYSGYGDLHFDVTLARTLPTLGTSSPVDPARAVGDPPRIFMTPDAVFPSRQFRQPTYVWMFLSHEMMHQVVRRLFAEHPELLTHGFALRNAAAPEMARLGYDGIFWDEVLGEQLARTLSIRVMQLTMPTITWAVRNDALTAGMAMVPWLEDALMRYEQHRSQYHTLGDFAGELARVLDSIPTDACKAAPHPGVALVGVARHRAMVGWMADDSPFRAKRLVVGDTVVAIDDDSVSSGGLLTPTRQLNLAWAQHLPYELGILSIRRDGKNYAVSAPIAWVPQVQVRIASQRRVASDSMPICRWVTRAKRN